jgi:hypothetical protein
MNALVLSQAGAACETRRTDGADMHRPARVCRPDMVFMVFRRREQLGTIRTVRHHNFRSIEVAVLTSVKNRIALLPLLRGRGIGAHSGARGTSHLAYCFCKRADRGCGTSPYTVGCG